MLSSLELHPAQIADRVLLTRHGTSLPSCNASVLRGAFGFMVVSVAGFCPWAIWGRTLSASVGELGMYLACLVVFLGLCGPLLHRLILGPGSLGRFYKLFGISFALYSVAWIAAWMRIGGHLGSSVGLFLGVLLMTLVLSKTFDAREVFVPMLIALFLLNVLGYFGGGWVEGWIVSAKPLSRGTWAMSKRAEVRVAQLMWGVCYGLGFGAGLGFAFHLCQEKARALLVR